MLILTRKPGESLHLGDHIKLKVLSVQGKQVKLGLDVPDDMTVYREEVYLKIKEQNRMALETSHDDLLAAASIWHGKEKKK
ncbi:carbon storage regulator CsrA [Salidesulfovibrio brasiliensis]|uniref:carbon storage regulator CsrA n=1 Tax=Salidesulfovibrio brasiliensis TaxID=221711 RepID=UPI0006D15858|nr:carbon storage regulator CsrA [Salidesulfovibrio brasiliensis]